jgi:uncharacterized protein
MKKIFIALGLLINGTIFAQKKISVLIVDGQNNHVQWPKVTMMVKKMLETSGRFERVDIQRFANTWQGDEYLEKYTPADLPKTKSNKKPEPDPNFAPDFSKYNVVITNFGWNAAPWPKTTQEAFETYMKKGGGLVVFHAADNSYPEWPAYNEMIGLGGWGNRNEKSGPYVYYSKDEEKLTVDNSKGPGGNHGPQHEYTVKIRDKKHPITKGMPAEWLHTKDELYEKLRGPGQNMKILATSFASATQKGTDRHEPNLMVLKYGKGRIFHNIMGHMDYSVNCVGFITTMLRGTEWAATGKVTIPIPADFPTLDKTSSRNLID